MSLSKRLFYNVYVTNGNLIGDTLSTSSTVANSVLSNITVSNANITNITSSSISLSGNLFVGGTLTTVNITSTNFIDTNLTVGTANITSNLLAVGNSNTIGNIYTTGGNVGIGIASPSYKLDVNGNAHIKANLYVDGLISGGTDTGSTFSYLTLTSVDDAINLSTGCLVAFGGITTQSPTDADSITNGGSFLTAGGASIGKRLFVGGGLISDYDSNTVGNIFTTGGNVGIGTNTPSTTLHVAGTMLATNISATGITVTNSVSTNLTTGSINSSTISSGNINISGNMVIGGTLTTLNITTTNVKDTNISTGTINVSSLATITNSTVTNMSTGVLNVTGITANNINFTGSLYQNGSVYISSQWLSGIGGNLSYTNGSVGIGTTSPTTTLDVVGSAKISSSISTGTINVSSLSTLNISGISTQFAASFSAGNNVISATNVNGFVLSNSIYGSFTSIVNVKLVTSTLNLNAQYYIEGVQASTGWFINDSALGDDVGITFTITNTGQLQYTSTNQTAWTRTTINYHVTAIRID